MLFQKTKSDKKIRSVILPVEEPLVKVYPHVAGIFSVYGKNQWELPMLLNEMVGILYDAGKERADFNISMEILPYMMNYPGCTLQCIPRKMVEERWKSFTEFLVSVLDDGFYVQCLLEAHKIPAYTESYGGNFFQHDMMIYGYDMGRGVFYGADAFEHGIYGFREVAFGDMERAWNPRPADDWLEGVRLFQPKKHHPQAIWYDLPYIREQCQAFAEGQFVKCAVTGDVRPFRGQENLYYGVEAYRAAGEYLRELRTVNPYQMADVRIFSVFRDHAGVMAYIAQALMRQGRLEDGDDICRKFCRLERIWENIISGILKYNLSENTECPAYLLQETRQAEALVKDAMCGMAQGICMDGTVENQVFCGSFCADSTDLEYTGKWKHLPSAVEDRYTTEEGAAVRWQFSGTKAVIYGSKKRLGQVGIFLDGQLLGESVMAEWELENGYPGYTVEAEPGYHVLEIRNLTSDGCSIHGVYAPGTEKGKSAAKFLGDELLTDIQWQKNCGKEGYEIVGDRRSLPWYVSEPGFVYRGAVYVLLDREGRSGQMPVRAGDKRGRVGAYQLAEKEFSLEMAVTGNHEVSFLCGDYDYLGREFVCLVEDADSGKELSRQAIALKGEAVLVKYQLSGHVKVRFLRVAGPDVVLSGVFFE